MLILPELQAHIDSKGGLVAFQQSQGLMADGAYGPKSANAALRSLLGLPFLAVPSASPGKDGIRRPGCDDAYGKFAFSHYPKDQIKTKHDEGRVVIDPQWEKDNIVWRNLWDGYGVKVHRLCIDEFDWIYKRAVDAGGYHPVAVNGYKPRHTLWNPAKSLSAHSWGCAIDFDPSRNDTGGKDAERGGPSLMRQHPAFLDVFRACGWACGYDWALMDDMHVQRAHI